MTQNDEVLAAMAELHDRDHSILGALLLYLHSRTRDQNGRAAVVNHAFDAAMYLAMATCNTEDRPELKRQIVKRMAETDISIYPPTQQLKDEGSIQGLFNEGMLRLSADKKLMSLLGSLSFAGSKPGVNDVLH